MRVTWILLAGLEVAVVTLTQFSCSCRSVAESHLVSS